MTVFNAPQGRSGGGLTVLVLDRFAIAAMSLPGGEIWNWGHGLGKDIRREAKELLALGGHNQTHRLSESTDYSVVPSGVGLIQINVRATANHALWFILGTKPHEIRVKHFTTYEFDPPRRSLEYLAGTRAGDTVLGWMKYETHGEIEYKRRVWHPGWHGYNYLDEAKLSVLILRGIV